MNLIRKPVVVKAAAACCGLGADLASMRSAILAGRHAMRPLREFGGLPARFDDTPGAWIKDRGVLSGRKYGAASNLAVGLAKAVVDEAGWSRSAADEAWIFAGSSRGNLCELFGNRAVRKGHGLYAASNSMHSEIAAAASIECGIRGPWHTFSDGCASGLDALIWAAHAVADGMAPRALVLSAELPLIGALLEDFASTGLLTSNGVNDPYSSATSGFFPAEAAAALAVEPAGDGTLLEGAWVTSDAYDPVGLPADGEGIGRVLEAAWRECGVGARDSVAICPHASGTRAHGLAEHAALRSVIAGAGARAVPVHLMKPFTGHSLGASGALDAAILHEFLRHGELPPNLAPVSGGCAELVLPRKTLPADNRTVMKISVGMGGHNALLTMKRAG